MICGFRRSGKDYLAEELKQRKCSWLIYHNPNYKIKFPSNDNYHTIALAKALKDKVHSKYCISIDIDKELVRDKYIEYATKKRNKDCDYWCKKLLLPNDKNIIITDFRYKNEKEYFLNKDHNIVTIRVFRSEVTEPDINIESEHDLDDELTDFLLVTSEKDFELAISRFPQYKNFTSYSYNK